MSLKSNDQAAFEHMLWATVGTLMAYKKAHLSHNELLTILVKLLELRPTQIDNQTAYKLAENACHEWGSILDFPPWA